MFIVCNDKFFVLVIINNNSLIKTICKKANLLKTTQFENTSIRDQKWTYFILTNLTTIPYQKMKKFNKFSHVDLFKKFKKYKICSSSNKKYFQ